MDEASKKLVYQNLACGVAPEAQARALDCSEEEVERVFREVGLAMAAWQLDNNVPYVPCQTLAAARQNKAKVLTLLPDVDLALVKKYHRVRAARVAVE